MNKAFCRILVAIFLAILFVNTTYGQRSNCSALLDSIVKILTENDAQFVQQEREEELLFNQKITKWQKIISEVENTDTIGCYNLLKQCLHELRRTHLHITKNKPLRNNIAKDTIPISLFEKEKASFWFDHRTGEKFVFFHHSTKEIIIYREIQKASSYVEGIPFLALRKTENQKNFYNVFNIEGDYDYSLNLRVAFYEKHFIHIGRYFLVKEGAEMPDIKFKDLYMASKFLFQQIDDTIAYVKIPSFDYAYEDEIEKLFSEQQSDLEKSNHLIIDLRNNGGGSDRTHHAILPWICTDTMKLPVQLYWSSEMNNRRMHRLKVSRKDNYGDFYINACNQLDYNLLSFVNLQSSVESTIICKSKQEGPSHIWILIDETCASSAESFILATRQSSKVKIVGRNSMGAWDYGNMNTFKFSSYPFTLWYTISKSAALPNFSVDKVGLQPDVYVPNQVHKVEWIRYLLDNIIY